jgi:hypothetical protein
MITHLDDAIAGRSAELREGGQLEMFETWRPMTPRPYRRRRRSLQPRAGRFEPEFVKVLGGNVRLFEVPGSRTYDPDADIGVARLADLAQLVDAYLQH